MSTEFKQWLKEQEQFKEMEQMVKTHLCSVCGSGLVIPWSLELNKIILACSKDRTHRGFAKMGDRAIQRLEGMRGKVGNDEQIQQEIERYIIQEHARKRRKK